jgi:hypothetical protein
MKTKAMFILMISLILSCKKSDNDSFSNTPVPLIKTLSTESDVIGNYWYDDQDRMTISRMVGDHSIDSTVYSYGNNSVEKRIYRNNTLVEVEHGTIENGNLVLMKGNKPDSSSYWSTQYTYDNNGFLILEVHMDNDTVETWRVEYQVQNNNIIKMTRTNYIPVTATMDYYSGSINSLGSIIKTGTFYGKNSSNLMKRCTMIYDFGTFEQNYNYEYYDNGWVKKLMSNIGSDTVNSFYTYW